jgi:anaerobic selenocysteine-containing dehydrogenase
MNRLGAALLGEMSDPSIKALYVFCASPVAAAPNATAIIEGMKRDDLFTVVHEQFPTDTARYADLVLPATTQLEQVDLHKAYGHRQLQFNAPAIAPLGEAKSNWDVMRLLAAGMGYDEPWLRQEPLDVITEILDVTRAGNPHLSGITIERLMAEGTLPLVFADGNDVPFADGVFPTPSGKLELSCPAMAAAGLDPVPDYRPPAEFAGGTAPDRLVLISGASHHFVSTSMGNQPSLIAKEGTPFVELNPVDAAARGINGGDHVEVGNERGSCQLRAVVTDNVPPGVAVAPKGRWARLSADGRNINHTTSDALGDLAGQSTFHSNLVTVRLVDPALAAPATGQASAAD